MLNTPFRFLVLCACCLSLSALAGQAANPTPQAQPQPGNGQNPGPGPGGPGPGGFGGPAFGPGPMDFMRGNVAAMIGRMTGLDVANTAAGTKDPKVETLPLGARRRLVINVPVGGVENPAGTGTGWKVEALFTLAAEQQGALQTLRSDYEKERQKLQAELSEAQKQLAQKAIQLRLQYEERANGLLTGADKETKLKMDALTADAGTRSETLVKDGLALYDPEDPAQTSALLKYLREKLNALATQTENSLLQLAPADRKPIIADVIRNNAAVRQQMMAFGMGGPPGGPRGGPRPDEAVKPPAPPETAPYEF
ncbi:MAG: hypothetical protein NTW87_18845 [Planctomycetota bacterium]|nr:hypothetical protein [Planctomycetota bacterium]